MDLDCPGELLQQVPGELSQWATGGTARWVAAFGSQDETRLLGEDAHEFEPQAVGDALRVENAGTAPPDHQSRTDVDLQQFSCAFSTRRDSPNVVPHDKQPGRTCRHRLQQVRAEIP